MDNDQDKNALDYYIKKLEGKEVAQIYNCSTGDEAIKEYSIKIKFHQLKAYFNLKRRLDVFLNNNSMNKNFSKCYLIDKNWFRKWKKHVGYEDIKKDYELHNINKEIEDNDTKWIESFIKKNSSENQLSPLDNKAIFDKNGINPLADFIIVDEICNRLFSLKAMGTDFVLSKDKSYPIKFSHKKIIVELSNLVYSIIFLRNISENEASNVIDGRDKPKSNKQIYIELLIIIKGENSNKENFIKDIEEKDMNKWIKDLNIDINNEKMNYINNIYFKIINKTISSHKKKYFMKNDITKREEEILNNHIKSISPNLQELLAKTMIWNFKTINKKNNEINNIINNDNNINLNDNNLQFNMNDYLKGNKFLI